MKQKLTRIAMGLFAFFLLLTAYYFYNISTRNAIETLAGNKKMINILIAGSNVFRENRHRFYGILSINPDNKKIGMTFLPPGLRINPDGKGKRYYKLGDMDLGEFSKISDCLNRDMKLKIPFYVELYASDVERIVDLIEGVNLFVLDPVKGVEGLKFGVNYLNGRKVMQYINAVEENSIFKKYDRIQDVIYTLFYSRESYKKFARMDFVNEAMVSLRTNLLPQEIMSIVRLLYADSDLLCTTLPGQLAGEGYYVFDDIAYKLFEKEFLKRLVVSKETDLSIKVKVLNSSGAPGLARKVRNNLMREGLNVVEFGTSPYPVIDNTVIINQKGDILPVKKVSEFLGVDRTYHIIDSTQLNNVLIILGKDLVK